MRYIFIYIAMLYVLLLVPGETRAASATMTASASFSSSPMIISVSNMNFGTVQAQTPGIYTMSTAGNITTGAGAVFLHGPTSIAQATIIGSATQTIDITSANLVANQGVTITNLRCKYSTLAERNCNSLANVPAAGSAGKPLKIGARINVNGSQLPGVTANPTFDIIATYH